jgi:tetratricopeptide (TPR) repeat protein
MKNKIIISVLALGLWACETVDPFEVVNPNLSSESIIGQTNSANTWLKGTERQSAIAFNGFLTISEIASDNYQNTNTFFNQFLDGLDIRSVDPSMNVAFKGISRLRETAKFGLEKIGPNDPAYSDVTKSEFHFYLGLSYMLTGEYFEGSPIEAAGPAVSAADQMQLAIDNFTEAINANGSNTKALAARARAYYNLGDRPNATADAAAVINTDPNFLFSISFDPVNSTGSNNGLTYTKNELQLALQERGSFDDLQPLPRLDFADPKMYTINSSTDSDVPVLKVEEMHLILAEANSAAGLDVIAQQNLRDCKTAIASRPIVTLDETAEDRSERNPGTRPDTAAVVVDGRSGLVKNRDANTTVHTISVTSISDAMIGVATGDNLLELIYLMRQEVFIAEGRRIIDMGVTFVMHENELLQNSNLTGSSLGNPNTPPFISAVADQLDDFTYDPIALSATTTIDVNSIIVANKTSNFVCPFH